MGSQDAPSPVSLKMLQHPLCTHGSHLATPSVAQSLSTAHSWEGNGFIQKPQPFPSHTLGCDPPFLSPLQEGAIRIEGWTLSCSCGLSEGRRAVTIRLCCIWGSKPADERQRELCLQQAWASSTPLVQTNRTCQALGILHQIVCWPRTV